MARSRGVLEAIVGLTELPRFQTLQSECERKLERFEDSTFRALFRTRQPVDPIEVEYARGFRQGIKYVLEGLPHEARLELERLNKESDPK